MYKVLYRKYRPQYFADVVGQPQVTVTLKNELMRGRIAHAYLFTGSRGTGKTTCAKILARAVNCLHPKDGGPLRGVRNLPGAGGRLHFRRGGDRRRQQQRRGFHPLPH